MEGDGRTAPGAESVTEDNRKSSQGEGKWEGVGRRLPTVTRVVVILRSGGSAAIG